MFALVFGGRVRRDSVVGGDPRRRRLTVGDVSNINEIILLKSTPHNLIHWVVGIALLAAFFVGMAKWRRASSAPCSRS